ncbi:hypothetical protein FDP25_10280 [Roseovarius sp. A21]|uniref:Uncharacterized protein n=1 Tax=Roseovarius bejariae TaxID=2576383 RepID=A0A844D1T7_9RHOB|nr:hypothetical protein [Roseovarius bejariae]MRU15813.1 hypothetical protein [Roseovarius bejariae]
MKRYSMPIVSTLAVLIAGPASADTLEFVCDFPRQATDEGVASQDFGMTFVVDTVSGDAFIKGNNGVAPVAVLRGDFAVTFLETLDSGAVQTTTVADTGEAVHSRHTILGGSVMSPSQNYGTCEW